MNLFSGVNLTHHVLLSDPISCLEVKVADHLIIRHNNQILCYDLLPKQQSVITWRMRERGQYEVITVL